MHQGDERVEEDVGRTYHCTEKETRAVGSNRTITGMGSRSTRIGKSR
jgi:hypothetical protein